MEATINLTFDDLVKLEPGLGQLFKKAKSYKPVLGKCCINDWYRDFKPRLVQLVGWFGKKDNSILRSKEAYDLSYKTIHAAMERCPDECRGCG